ncbi:MAG: hypothetical protein ACK5N0_03020, partial [Synechococcaceae cyanobacterium]
MLNPIGRRGAERAWSGRAQKKGPLRAPWDGSEQRASDEGVDGVVDVVVGDHTRITGDAVVVLDV